MDGALVPPAVARRHALFACALCVATGLLCAQSRSGSSQNGAADSLVFVAGGQVSPLRTGKAPPLAVVSGRPQLRGFSDSVVDEHESSPLRICGLALAASLSVAACHRALGVAMRSQGQGGRGNFGQFFMPTIKGPRKKSFFRKRKNYGSHQARRLPRRYPLYDKLEEYDKTLPVYTIISEPEEPLKPVEGPLTERYPWAGDFRVDRKTYARESDKYTRKEPFFAHFVHESPAPRGLEQQFVHRRGWPTQKYPPWLNKPLAGSETFSKNSWYFRSYRKPAPWQYKPEMRHKLFPEEYDEKGRPYDDDEEDEELDDILEEDDAEE